MTVQNRIVKIQKRNRALVKFDPDRIRGAILRAAESIGGFRQDFLPGIHDRLFEAFPADDGLAGFLAESVTVCLNANPHHLIANFPPRIETIQDQVLHVLRSYGFQNTADAYECYRWGRHWLREGAIRPAAFAGNGFPGEEMAQSEAWNRRRGCHTLAGLNELVRGGRLQPLIEESLALYERALDEAGEKVLARCGRPSGLRLIWISGPSASGKTTTAVKLTQRLRKHGLRLQSLNLDDYFWSLVEHPTDWINDRNYETPEAIDIQLANDHLKRLLDGKAIDQPVFSFKEGRRIASRPMQLAPDEVLLLDCLHGLYPPMTEGIDPAAQFRLYLEPMNALHEGESGQGRLTRSTDVRQLRRTLRDAQHRNHGPLLTLLHWHYVRSGELSSIIPLRGLADHVVNTGFPFELPFLKAFLCEPTPLLPRLEELEDYRGFLDARIRWQRLHDLMRQAEGIPLERAASHDLLPGDALLREFIGGSTLRIPHNE